jgi:hypothetical protein
MEKAQAVKELNTSMSDTLLSRIELKKGKLVLNIVTPKT